jgi:hypothetical protein
MDSIFSKKILDRINRIFYFFFLSFLKKLRKQHPPAGGKAYPQHQRDKNYIWYE